MVTCLAGSLALVTCKEPLRGALAQHLRQLLQVCAASPSRLTKCTTGRTGKRWAPVYITACSGGGECL